MLNKKWALLIVAPLVTMAIGCQTASPETVTVKETVVAEVPVTVEVTRVVEASVEVTRVVETPVEQSVPNTPSINPMMPIEFDTIESSVTGREYAITIALPLSYMFSDADYPVIYVTDGDFYAIPLALAAGQLAFGQEVSEFIVVGVDYGNPDPMKWLELRELDMGVDGRENYLQFFEEELIPYIEATYRADPANRTLAGHSSGGNFALYGLLNGANTFSNFIASSPGNIAGLVDSVDNFAANQGGTMTKLYLSVGDLDAEETIAGVEAFDNALVEMRADGLIHKMAVLDNETHLSARPRAFNNGLRRLFAGDWEEDALASRTTQEVFDSHQAAIENMDIEKLMADYAEDATLLTVNGPLIGKEAILTGFFQASLEQFPDMEVTYGEVVCEDDICLLKWSAEATNGDIPVGIGALLIQDGLIQRQIEWFEVTPKED